MRHCRQCRADAIGLLGHDLGKELFEPKKLDGVNVDKSFKVAVTSSTKDGWVDLHFGNTPRFLIYEIGGDTFQLREARDVELSNGKTDLPKAVDLLSDCQYIITRRAGPRAVEKLKQAGIEVVEDYNPVEIAIKNVIQKSAETSDTSV